MPGKIKLPSEKQNNRVKMKSQLEQEGALENNQKDMRFYSDCLSPKSVSLV